MENEQFLTFAQAMALGPSEVEAMRYSETGWRPHDDWQYWNHNTLSKAQFRRARPKRSRVQELAELQAGKDGSHMGPDEMTLALGEAVRAVCDWLRQMSLEQQRTGQDWAGKVEREFLGPR